uniref:Uncharacterized protein n=1 Tax=Kalanchoe fedtschenkoi TaxID=63787 RepID=A0A7N0VLL7_KALFE
MVHKGREGFKCAGALCLYLPAFIKPGKPLTKKQAVDIQSIISRTMSLEKFECGSWSAAAIVTENTAEDHCSEEDYDHGASVDRQSINLYYELPLEMMQTGKVRELFEKRELKGILTNSQLKAGEGRKSKHDPSRHVRFSTETPTLIPSSPTSCITPRLRQAREEFAAFLEAQNA